MDEIDERVKTLGAVTYRDCIVSGTRLLSRHYFDKDGNKIAVFSVPTAYLTTFDSPEPYVVHAGVYLSQPTALL